MFRTARLFALRLFAARLFAGMAVASIALSCAPDEAPDAGIIDHGGIVPKDGGPIVRADAGIDPRLLPCEEDAREDNDSSASATAIAVSTDVAGALCGGDEDWFTVPAAVGCSIDARIAFDPLLGDLDLHLFAPSGALLAAATTAAAEEHVQANATTTGAHLVRVTGPTTSKAIYTLRVEVVCEESLACPADDPYEPNDDIATAQSLDDGDEAAGIICAEDDDTYVVPSAPGCILDARLTFEDADGDLDLDLVVGDRTIATAHGSSNEERIVKAVPDGTSPVFKVFGFQSAENTYRLLVDSICPSELSCPADDPFEPNDASPDAVALTAPDTSSGILCGTDEDWYEVTLTTGCTATIELLFTHASGDLDLKLLRNALTQAGTSASTDDDEKIVFPVDTGGRFFIRAYGYEDAENRYRLLVTQDCP